MFSNKKYFLEFFKASGIILGAIIIFFWPLLFGGKVLADPDPLLQVYPLFSQLNQLIQNHLYLPYLLGGYTNPVWFTNLEVDFLYLFLAQFFYFLDAYHWLLVFYFFLTGIFLYLLARNLNLSFSGALLSSLVFVLSEYCLFRGRLEANARYFFFLPLFFYLLTKINQGRKWLVVPAGLVTGFAWWLVDTRFLVYIILAGFFYWIYLIYRKGVIPAKAEIQTPSPRSLFPWKWGWERSGSSQRMIKENRGMVFSFFFIILLSLFVGFSFLLKGWVFSQETLFQGNTFKLTEGLTLFDFFRFLSPYLKFDFWANYGAHLYIGLLPLFLALIAVFKSIKNPCRSFFVFLFFFFFLLALKFSPLAYVFSKIPFLGLFKKQSRFIFFIVFSLSLLAGLGFDYLSKKFRKIDFELKFLKWLIYFWGGLALILTLAFGLFKEKIFQILNWLFDKYFYQSSMTYPPFHYHQVIKERVLKVFNNFSFTHWHFLLPFGFLLLAYFWLCFYQRKKVSLANFKKGTLVLVVINLLLVSLGYYRLIDRSLYLTPPEVVEIIKQREKNLSSFRIFSFVLADEEYQKAALPFKSDPEKIFLYKVNLLEPNLNLLYGLYSIDGYDRFMTRRQAQVLAQIGSNRAPLKNRLIDKDSKLVLKEFLKRINLLGRLNVKYILSSQVLNHPDLELVFRKKILPNGIEVYLYQNKKFWPKVYFAQRVRFVSVDEKENLAWLLANGDSKEVLIETEEVNFWSNKQKEIILKEKYLQVEKSQPTYWKIKIKTDYPSWLVFSESYQPAQKIFKIFHQSGWQAFVDGQGVKIYRANYLFQAIPVPVGEHWVEFEYK